MNEKMNVVRGLGFLSMLGAGSVVALVVSLTVVKGSFDPEMFLDFPMALWGSWAALGAVAFFGSK